MTIRVSYFLGVLIMPRFIPSFPAREPKETTSFIIDLAELFASINPIASLLLNRATRQVLNSITGRQCYQQVCADSIDGCAAMLAR
jgi:hypothetical protein